MVLQGMPARLASPFVLPDASPDLSASLNALPAQLQEPPSRLLLPSSASYGWAGQLHAKAVPPWQQEEGVQPHRCEGGLPARLRDIAPARLQNCSTIAPEIERLNAVPSAAGLSRMSRCVVVRSWCSASSRMARAVSAHPHAGQHRPQAGATPTD